MLWHQRALRKATAGGRTCSDKIFEHNFLALYETEFVSSDIDYFHSLRVATWPYAIH